MEIEKFSRLRKLYLLSLVIGLGIYFYLKVENNTINMQEERFNIIIIIILLIIAAVILGIEMAARQKNEKFISKSMIYGGISIAAVFIIFRLLMSIF
jgi:cytochrome bd-type quinol oxidase subunit 2